MKLEDLQVYHISMKLADEVHDLVIEWDNFHKFSTGTQLVDAADSVSVNISEGLWKVSYTSTPLEIRATPMTTNDHLMTI